MQQQEISRSAIEMVKFYRNCPVIAAEDLLSIELAIPQQCVIMDFWFNKFSIITASRGVGKSYLLACFACLKAMLYPGTRVGILAPSFRQSKVVFSEVQKMWLASPILREATVGKPTFQSDRCVLNFRSIGTTPPSLIEADPLGTGDKIRGARYHVLLVDEFAQVPSDIFDAVIKPMAATSSSPMERVKQVSRLKDMRLLGASEEDLDGYLTTNSIIMASSAFFKFNHMYQRIQEYEKFIEEGKTGYSTRTINYLDMPDGFMNEEVIEEAQKTMPASLFRMEYLGIWESDSDGVFKASLIEKCRLLPGDSVKLIGEEGRSYIVACDPAKTTDFFSIIVLEVGEGEKASKVVNAMQFSGMRFPKMADKIMEVCELYNPIRVIMDSQGGGHSIKDILCDSVRYGSNIIIDIDDEEFFGVEGRRILQLINPTPTLNAEINWAALTLLEQGKLKFPGPPLSGIEKEEEAYEVIQTLIMQMLTIVATSTKTGNVHFDVPDGGGHGKQKKDLYSAFIYGAKKLYDLNKEVEDTGNIIWSTGISFSREVKSSPTIGFIPTLISPSAVLRGNR